jgi:hypothetical protein
MISLTDILLGLNSCLIGILLYFLKYFLARIGDYIKKFEDSLIRLNHLESSQGFILSIIAEFKAETRLAIGKLQDDITSIRDKA